MPALWEALWTNPHTPHFHLYVALVLLQYKRKDILCPELHYGRMHEICASLRGTVDLQVRAPPPPALQCCRADSSCVGSSTTSDFLSRNIRRFGELAYSSPVRDLGSAACPGYRSTGSLRAPLTCFRG